MAAQEPSAEAIAEALELYHRLCQCLPEPLRRCLDLRLDRHSLADIAADLGTSVATAARLVRQLQEAAPVA